MAFDPLNLHPAMLPDIPSFSRIGNVPSCAAVKTD